MPELAIDNRRGITIDNLCYAGFWRRLGAMLLDLLVMLPLMGLMMWGMRHYRLFQAYYFVPGFLFSLFYGVYLVRRYGGTPGKILAGLRIRRLDGVGIGYREALLRESPDLVLSLILSACSICTLMTISDAEYLSMTSSGRHGLIRTLVPAVRFIEYVQYAWWASELVVMLTNRKRRALHNFLAGTVVVVNTGVRTPVTNPSFSLIP